MFDIVYIILAFDNPDQIKRLVTTLDSKGVWFYIHVDKKVDQQPFELSLNRFLNVKFVDASVRHEISWGDNKMVKSIVNLMKMVDDNHQNGYCVLLSNNDYPIRSNSTIRTYFANKFGKSFMSMAEFDKNSFLYKQRLNYYKFELSKKRKDIVLIASIWEKEFYSKSSLISFLKVIKSNQAKNIFKIFKKRKDSIGMKAYLGSSWWAIPIEVMSKIVTFCASNPDFVKYHEETFISDEIFFQSILKYLQKNDSINTIIDGRITYLKFVGNDSSPLVLGESDFDDIKQLPERFLFVRKLDAKKDSKIFDLIDAFKH